MYKPLANTPDSRKLEQQRGQHHCGRVQRVPDPPLHHQATLRIEEASTSVVVVYHVTIVTIGHGLLKKFWSFGTSLRSTHCREFNHLKLCRPAYLIGTTQLLPHPGHE